MTDIATPEAEAPDAAADRARVAVEQRLAYLRHLAGLGFAAAGGVVTLAGTVLGELASEPRLWIILGVIVAAALSAGVAQDALIRDYERGKPFGGYARFLYSAAIGALYGGFGAFMGFAGNHMLGR